MEHDLRDSKLELADEERLWELARTGISAEGDILMIARVLARILDRHSYEDTLSMEANERS